MGEQGNGRKRGVTEKALLDAVRDELVGTFEAHLILGVERSRIARWLSENKKGKAKIPEPVARLQSGPVWLRSQIEEKLRDLAAAADVPTSGPAFDQWAAERSLARAKQIKVKADENGRERTMSTAELTQIIRRPVSARKRAAAVS